MFFSRGETEITPRIVELDGATQGEFLLYSMHVKSPMRRSESQKKKNRHTKSVAPPYKPRLVWGPV